MKCKKCGIDKELDDFQKANNKSGYESSCKDCRSKRKYELRRNKRIENGLNVHMSTIEAKELLKQHKKYCPKCEKIKDLDEFSTMKKRSGIASHCRECNREMLKIYYSTDEGKKMGKERYIRDKIKLKDSVLKREFGISLDEYNVILKNQGSGCAICGRTKEKNGKMLAVDHDHETKKNRSILCASCNLVIGFIEKNNFDIEKIKEYINKHKINNHVVSTYPQPL
jgi:hypothetical protein